MDSTNHPNHRPENRGAPGAHTATADAVALDMIAQLTDRTEWDADTLDMIADVVRSTGREIGDVNEPPATDSEQDAAP